MREIKIINQGLFSFTPGVKTLLLDAINLRDLTGFNGKSHSLQQETKRHNDLIHPSLILLHLICRFKHSTIHHFSTKLLAAQ